MRPWSPLRWRRLLVDQLEWKDHDRQTDTYEYDAFGRVNFSESF
jgi:hypothetical protein